MNFKLLPIALAVTGVFALTQRPVFAAEADAERSYGDEGYDVIALEPEAPAALARAAEPRGLTIEEVVVTAQKKQEAVSTVPISISAFSGEDLAALGVTDVRDLRNVVPGFNASDSGYNTPVYTLRGVGFNDSTYSATSTVGLYVDEVNLPYSIMSKGATIDLERVEVLKGPQGILYGRNTTGGLINYIAKKPTDTFEAGLSATYGRFNATDLEGYVSGPLTETIKGRLAVRDIRSQDGWQESVTRPGDTLGRQDKQSFRGALEWTASDTLDMRLAVEGWRDRSEPQAPQAIGLKVQQPIVPNTPELVQRLLGVLPPALTSLPVIQSLLAGNVVLAPQVAEYPFLTPQTDDPQLADWSPDVDWRLNDQFISASLRADWSFAEAYKLTGLLSYLDMESKDSELPQTGLNSLNAERRLNAYIRTTAAEIRLSRDAGDDYSWLIGFNGSYDDGYEHAKTYQQTISAAFPVLGTGLSDSVAMFGDQDATQLAVYANGDYRLSETLRASGGVRYTYEKRRYVGCDYVITDSSGPLGLPGLFPVLFSVVPILNGGFGVVLPGTGHQEPGQLVGDCFAVKEGAGPGLFRDQIEDRNVSWRAALDWTPADDTLLYASLAKGFKSGGYPVLNATVHSQFTPTEQEELLSYEVGSKQKLFDKKLVLNTALFYYDYRNKQLLTRMLDPVFGALPILRNAPRSHVYGAELEIQANPLRGLFVGAAAAYIKTEIDEFVSTNIDGKTEDFAGKPFNFAPEWTASVVADYTLPYLPFELFSISLGADLSYSGATNSTLENDPRFAHEPYTTVGARLRLSSASDAWNLTFFGRNLSNELQTISSINVGDSIGRFVGQPRTYGATLELKFR